MRQLLPLDNLAAPCPACFSGEMSVYVSVALPTYAGLSMVPSPLMALCPGPSGSYGTVPRTATRSRASAPRSKPRGRGRGSGEAHLPVLSPAMGQQPPPHTVQPPLTSRPSPGSPLPVGAAQGRWAPPPESPRLPGLRPPRGRKARLHGSGPFLALRTQRVLDKCSFCFFLRPVTALHLKRSERSSTRFLFNLLPSSQNKNVRIGKERFPQNAGEFSLVSQSVNAVSPQCGPQRSSPRSLF